MSLHGMGPDDLDPTSQPGPIASTGDDDDITPTSTEAAGLGTLAVLRHDLVQVFALTGGDAISTVGVTNGGPWAGAEFKL